MLFEKAGAKLVRIEANIRVTSENDMNLYQKDMFQFTKSVGGGDFKHARS